MKKIIMTACLFFAYNNAQAADYGHAQTLQLLTELNPNSISVPIDHEIIYERCYVSIATGKDDIIVNYHTTANRIAGSFVISKKQKINTLLQATDDSSGYLRIDYTKVIPFGPGLTPGQPEEDTVRLSVLTAGSSVKEFRIFSTNPARFPRLECYF